MTLPRGDAAARILACQQANASWSSVRKAMRRRRPRHMSEAFGSGNVENTNKSFVRPMLRETGLTLKDLSSVVEQLADHGTDF
jgi:hypothetical protein